MDDRGEAEFFLVGEEVLVSVVDLLVIRHAHALVIALGFVFHLGAAFVDD